MEELGLGVASRPFRSASTFFLTRPRLRSNLDVSIEVARRRADLPGLASGLIIHQELLPVPSFCTLMKRLCRDRLCRIEFCNRDRQQCRQLFCLKIIKERQRYRILNYNLFDCCPIVLLSRSFKQYFYMILFRLLL